MKYKSKIEFHDLGTRMSSPRQKLILKAETSNNLRSNNFETSAF